MKKIKEAKETCFDRNKPLSSKRWLLDRLLKRLEDQFYWREDLTSERPQWSAQNIYSITRKNKTKQKTLGKTHKKAGAYIKEFSWQS